MASTVSVAMLLVQVPLGIGGSAVLIIVVTWHQKSRSAINCCRLAIFRVALVLALLVLFGADLLGIQTVAHKAFWPNLAESRQGNLILTHQISRRSICFVIR